VFDHLQIYDRRERLIVGMADAVLGAGAAFGRLVPRRPRLTSPSRILLLRLERIGDLLMSAGAIESVRRHAPSAHIALVVGSWNADVARCLLGVDRVETLDPSWLARGAGATGVPAMVRRAAAWRDQHFDLTINFEGDIRSHALMALARAPERVGFDMAGGGPLLTRRVPFDATLHTSVNAARLVAAAFAAPVPSTPPPFRLLVPDGAREHARYLLAGHACPIALHASGGRAIKQWDLERFAAVGARLARELEGSLVLTGTTADQPLVEQVRARLPPDLPVLDLAGRVELLTLAGVLERCALLVTGDTGPMHLAAAVGTRVVAVFGPSTPARYAPIGTRHRVVRVDLPCAPCNRIRLPPERCQGHTPDCLTGVTVEAVHDAAMDLLRGSAAS
jgi:ADP-heptose:LPS heptosyltransferase